jgi:hypothetical protein
MSDSNRVIKVMITRGIKIGFKEGTPTIPSRKQICMVGLKIFIQSSKGIKIGNMVALIEH